MNIKHYQLKSNKKIYVYITDIRTIAKSFNNHFCQIGKNLADKIPNVAKNSIQLFD